MMFLIAVTRFPASSTATEDCPGEDHRLGVLLRRPQFVLAVVAQFAYVGAQVGTWSYFIPYVVAYTNRTEKAAGFLLTTSLVLFGQPSRLMAVYALVNTVLALIGVLIPGWTGAIALLLTSLFMSLMYPTIFALGIRGLGKHAKIGGSLIVMAIVGGAVLTPVMGLLSVQFGSVAIAYAVPVVAYIFVACYSFVDIHLQRPVASAALPIEV
jgi:FHS family L-fucose permease-like MFS transporter